MQKKVSINSEDTGKRLDAVLTARLKDHSRSQIKKWIEDGNVRIGGAPKKASYKVRAGDEIVVDIEPPRPLQVRAENILLNIVYEDPDIIVVNKTADMVVHPAAGNFGGTLVNALLHHCRDLSGIGGVLRPGIVHRLDKGTSGLIVVAKNDLAHLGLAAQFKGRKVTKIYYAVIYGVPRFKKGTFEQEIGRHPTDRKKMSTTTRKGREAVTNWDVVKNFGKHFSLVKIRLITGRTHQIRVHFSANGMPLVGDMVYGGKKTVKRVPEGKYRDMVEKISRPLLHAANLTFQHPRSFETMSFNADLPEDFESFLEDASEI